MEHDEIYGLMMDALDGELASAEQAELESHLRACPDCLQEWQAMVAIDTLFRQSPVLSPAADFTQRTIALLPNRRLRIWAMGTIYLTLFVSGLLPLALVALGVILLSPVVQRPAIVDSAIQLFTRGVQLFGTVVGGMFAVMEQVLLEQPAILGWLLVMAGIVFLWNGVYRQLLSQPVQQRSRI